MKEKRKRKKMERQEEEEKEANSAPKAIKGIFPDLCWLLFTSLELVI